MTKYTSLTKKIKDENGNDIVVCKYYGTDECRNIHKLNECPHSCPVIGIMLETLNMLEVAVFGDDGEAEND